MLPISFFTVALLYATVGFGGGSSYLALLAVSNIPYELLPKIALVCNLLVVSGGCYHYYRKGHFNLKLILPFVLASIPMAFLGGMYPIKENAFLMILSVCLILAGARLFFVTKSSEDITRPSIYKSALLGGALGFLSGLVGIGGGIFLAPLMLNLKWGRPKEVAAVASAFIFLNSIAGLLGQLTKSAQVEVLNYWPLFLAVIVGGQIGSRIGTHNQVSQKFVQTATGVLILFIGVRLLLKIL